MPGHRFQFEKLAKLDDPRRLERQPPARLAEALPLSADTEVLDVGVGAGYFALPIAERLEKLGGWGRVTGLDVEPRILSEFKKRAGAKGLASRVEVIQAPDAEQDLTLEPGAFDLAVLGHVYHEIADPGAYLAKLYRALRPGGSIWVVDWSPDHLFDFGPPMDHRVPEQEVIRAIHAAGFEPVTSLDVYKEFTVVRGDRS